MIVALGPDPGQVERVVRRLVGILLRHHLHAITPFREVAFFDCAVKIFLGRLAGPADDLSELAENFNQGNFFVNRRQAHYWKSIAQLLVNFLDTRIYFTMCQNFLRSPSAGTCVADYFLLFCVFKYHVVSLRLFFDVFWAYYLLNKVTIAGDAHWIIYPKQQGGSPCPYGSGWF